MGSGRALRSWPKVALALVWGMGSCADEEAPRPRPVVADAPTVEASKLAPVSRVETTDEWLDLVAQRPSTVVRRQARIVVDLGRPQARAHLALTPTPSWKLASRVTDRMAGVVLGRGGSLEIPLDGDLAPALNPDTEDHPGLAMAVTLHALAPKQLMTVLWEEKPLAHLRIGEGWARRTLSLPADVVHAGENRLRFHFRRSAPGDHGEAAAAITTVEIGTHERIVEGAPIGLETMPYAVEGGGVDPTHLSLPVGTGLAWYVVPPRRGRLHLEVAGQGSVTVVASTDEDHTAGRPPTQLFQEPLRPTGSVHEVDLSGFGGQPTRLELAVVGSGPEAGLRLMGASILVRRSIPIDRRSRRLRDLYVIAIEGARGDELFVPWGGRHTKGFNALVRDALVFERAHAVGAWAVQNHAAWLSSVPPPVHRTVRGTFLADRQVLLPELLDRSGYFSALVTANRDVNAERGLLQGFDSHELISGGPEDKDGRAVLDAGYRSLEQSRGPRFLYAAVNDPQAPFDPPRELVKSLEVPAGAPLPHLTHIWVGRVRTGRTIPSDDELDYVRRLYRAELEVIDQGVTDLFDRFRAGGRLDESIVVIVGLHGEEFLEHESAGHGRTLHEESIHVPLAIWAPQLLAPGRVSTPVDILDLAPTLADLLGLPFPDTWSGESLVPIIDDPQPPPRLVVAYLGDGSQAGIVGRYKLIQGSGTGQQFFDLGSDPAEAVDRLADGGIALRMVRTALAWQMAYLGAWRRARWGTGANFRPAFALDLGM